ncbi:glycosyltransferase family 2 protein [Pararhodospirillum oryzae]|uniref:Succinoglycan biosynthesis protein exoa n=1 Tax=Pararhodospirillum oryzae TaxID=478448 RepID=A0A512H3S4_9PROT|nr:glycosyltransferase family 2 protein [Pararhodospirillum oryzae]GEO80119.1 succinoglycan biosynthesis protein exoa [Pararhodospirillum oryzae]
MAGEHKNMVAHDARPLPTRDSPSSGEGEDGPTLTIVMPALDEERHIAAALASLTRIDTECYEILVMDGGSRDETRAIVARLAADNPRIRLIDNPARRQAAAVNLAASLAAPSAEVLVRADCHALYPDNFASEAARRLRATGATAVVVPLVTTGVGCMQRAIAAAQNSRLGNGGAVHRRLGVAGFVDHGHHAAFDLEFYRRLGGYDPSFSHNEDAEFDLRQARAGGRIWLEPTLAVTYYPRETLRELARQYFRYGAGRARTVRKHRVRLRVRQLAPVALVGVGGAGLLLAPWLPQALLVPLAYGLLCLGWGGSEALRHRDPCLLASGAAAVVMHVSWAFGFLRAIARPV